jgi:probable F420-dependent oxidoreductase
MLVNPRSSAARASSTIGIERSVHDGKMPMAGGRSWPPFRQMSELCATLGDMRFRFAVSAPALTSRAAWADELRRLEDAGFDTVVVADHFTEGWAVEPMVALTAAAMETSKLRLQTGVLGNDYRHPVLVHRMAATLDTLSEGRLTLGLGAGWLVSDYERAGIPLDPPGIRIERLEAAVGVLKGLFAGTPLHHDGRHYRIDGLVGRPEPVQRPHPPLLLGGGSPRVLRLAGREADIVSIVASLRAGSLGAHAVADLSAQRVKEKLDWVREGMAQAARCEGDVTLSINHWLVRVTATKSEADTFLGRIAQRNGVDPVLLSESPAVLVGTTERLADVLGERRERFGFAHLQLDAGFPPSDVASLFPLVGRLAGT